MTSGPPPSLVSVLDPYGPELDLTHHYAPLPLEIHTLATGQEEGDPLGHDAANEDDD